MERWTYCAVKDQPDISCAWPICTCGLQEARVERAFTDFDREMDVMRDDELDD